MFQVTPVANDAETFELRFSQMCELWMDAKGADTHNNVTFINKGTAQSFAKFASTTLGFCTSIHAC